MLSTEANNVHVMEQRSLSLYTPDEGELISESLEK